VKPPADCPCCGGDGKRHDGYMGTVDAKAKCPACSGTGKAPRGCQSSACAEAARRQRETRGQGHNQHAPWSAAEDAFILAADDRLRRKGNRHRPKGWVDALAGKLAARFPGGSPRTVTGIRQRITKLRKGNGNAD